MARAQAQRPPTPRVGWPSPPRCLGWEGCSGPWRSGCSGRPCPKAHALEQHPGLGWRPCGQNTDTGQPRRLPRPRSLGRAALGRPGSTTNPVMGGLLQLRPSPLLPAPRCGQAEGVRRPAGAGAQSHLASRLSPWEKSLPAPAPTRPLTPVSSVCSSGPRPGCCWDQGWASLRLFTRQGRCGHTPENLLCPTPHQLYWPQKALRQERSLELGLDRAAARVSR